MDTLNLFSPINVGSMTLKNRIVMAPMTRSRASHDHVPSELAIEYYSQRASAGLIITEGTAPSANGEGYPRTPGLYNQAQIDAWGNITDKVHQQGGKIVVQLMHVGRIAHSLNKAKDSKTVAPSAIKADGMMFTDQEGMQPLDQPTALTSADIEQVVEEYKQATDNAFKAGFDGVELHAANGYLPMQFLSSNSNQRDDQYGGSAENRIRFVIELLNAMCQVKGSEQIGIRISPGSQFNDMHDANPAETYEVLLQALTPLSLAYVHAIGSPMNLPHKPNMTEDNPLDVYDLVKKNYQGIIIGNAGFDLESGNKAIAEHTADLISFGALYIANPDLVERFKQQQPFNPLDTDTFYSPGAKGYTDYPLLG